MHGRAGDIVVIVFTSVDCPVANAMAPQLARTFDVASDHGARCYLVYPGEGMTIDAASEHARQYGLDVSVGLDPSQGMVHMLDARITPEAFVLQFTSDGVWAVRYRGRINDLYTSIGNRRDLPSTHDLQDAVIAISEGVPVKTPNPPAVGCLIERRN